MSQHKFAKHSSHPQQKRPMILPSLCQSAQKLAAQKTEKKSLSYLIAAFGYCSESVNRLRLVIYDSQKNHLATQLAFESPLHYPNLGWGAESSLEFLPPKYYQRSLSVAYITLAKLLFYLSRP